MNAEVKVPSTNSELRMKLLLPVTMVVKPVEPPLLK
jgi:hypothetical protein